MNSFDVRFHREMDAALDDEIARLVDAVASGAAADHADYRNRCGQIRALREAKRIAEDTRKALLRDDEGED